MSVDFSKEPIGKPRWCITRGGEVRLAWREDDDPTYPVRSSNAGDFETHTVNGLAWEDDEKDEDLVSFAPPDCDSFFWKAPEPIKVGDWVEITVYERGAKVGEKVQVVHVGQSLIRYTHPSTTDRLGASIGCYRKCDPPSPRYRPFANAEEFLQHAYRWMRYTKNDKQHHIRCDAFNDKGIIMSGESRLIAYQELQERYVFADTNEPCGVKVDA